MKNHSNYQALAFFDLDGTLLNGSSELDQEVIDGLTVLRKNGVLPFIATGRAHFGATQIMKQSGISGVIAMNGHYILLDGQPIYREAIPTENITKLLNVAHQQGEGLVFYDDDHFWISDAAEGPASLVQKAFGLHGPVPDVSADSYLQQDIYMLLVLTDQLSQVDYYKSHVPELSYFNNSDFSIDVTNAGTNKGTGVAHVKQVLGFDGPTYGFGDGRNDLDLLNACDHKTAMGNAVPELKAIADFVSTTNSDQGILTAFKHWGLI